MRLISVLAVVLFLSACATATLDKGIPRFVGKDIGYAIKYLGYPDSEIDIDGKKVYVWQNQFNRTGSVTSYRPQYTTTFTPFGSVSSYSTVQESTPININGECKIRLITAKGKVVDAEFEGNEFGCEKYSDRVQKLIDDTEPKEIEPKKKAK